MEFLANVRDRERRRDLDRLREGGDEVDLPGLLLRDADRATYAEAFPDRCAR